MEENTKKNRQNGAAAAFIDARLAAGHVAFPLADLVRSETGLSVTAAKNQLRRLGSLVVRVSRVQQFFLIVSPEHRFLGALCGYVVARQTTILSWLEHPYYLALQSAAGTYTVPITASTASDSSGCRLSSSRREIEVGRLRVHGFSLNAGLNKPQTQPHFSERFRPDAGEHA